MEDREYARHCGSSYEAGGDGSAALLSSDLFFHESSISFLLFDGTSLGAKGGLKDVVQLDLIGDAILSI